MAVSKYARCYLHHYTKDRFRVKTFGPFKYILPYGTGIPASNLQIVKYGLITDNYAILESNIHEFSYTGSWLVNTAGTVYSYANFQNYFPDFRDLGRCSDLGIVNNQGTDNDWLVLENVENGRVLANHINVGGGDKYYNSLNDFEGNISGTDAGTVAQHLTVWTGIDGSGATRGRLFGIAYKSLDEQGNPNDFYIYYFNGVTSTENNIRLAQCNTATGFNASALIFFFQSVKPLYPEPYDDFPPSEEDHGDPDPDQEDDEIDIDPAPDVSFADAGLCRIYRPNLTQLRSFANYIWTDQTFLDTLINHAKMLLENPIDAVISLSIIPCTPAAGQDVNVAVMYIPTGVYMPPVTEQYPLVDCGTYRLTEMYGSALDYNPYTKVQLYLPYVGTVQLDTDEVMGKLLHVYYRIDVVTGTCCAYVKADDKVLYQFSGHCAIFQPVSAADFSGYLNAAITAAKTVAAVAAAGSAPSVAQTLVGAPTASMSGSSSSAKWTERNPATGRQITSKTKEEERITENPGASFGEIATRGISNTVGAVQNSKTEVQHSGGFSGNTGFLAKRRPYLIIKRPRIANPKEYGKYNGYPSMMYLHLGDCSGYTQIQSIQLTGISATNPELSEINTLLTSGVIL